MPKTKEFTINCSAIRVESHNHRFVTVTVEDPDMNDIFAQFNEDDIIEYVNRNIDPGDVYPADTLADWAERNGYTKTPTND